MRESFGVILFILKILSSNARMDLALDSHNEKVRERKFNEVGLLNPTKP